MFPSPEAQIGERKEEREGRRETYIGPSTERMDGQEDVDSDTEERGGGGDDAETTADVKEWISASAAGNDAAVTEEGLAATVDDAGAPFAMARV
jgi:hypothetical protein